MADKNYLKFLLGYESSEQEGTLGKRFAVIPISGSVKRAGETKLGRMIIGLDDRLDRLLSYTSMRAYGLFLLGFGLLSLLIHFAKDYFGFYDQVPFAVLLLGSVFAVLGVPFILSDKPIAEAFADNAITDFIFFEFFCIKRTNGKAGRGIPSAVALIIGLALAVLGGFLPMKWVGAGIGITVYLVLAVSSPEFSFFSTFLVMPYLSLVPNHEIILSVIVGITTVSFIRKVMLGKRVLYFEQYDIILTLFVLLILATGVFIKGIESFTESVSMAMLAMGYPMVGGMLTNRRVADRAVSALVLSSVPVSIYSIYQASVALFSGSFSGYGGSSATFATPSVLASYLLVALVFAVYFVAVRRNPVKRGTYAAIAIITLLGLVCTLEVWALVAAIFGLAAYLAKLLSRTPGVITALLGILPYGVLALSDEVLMRLASYPVFSSMRLGEFAARFSTSFSIFKDNILLGIGIGPDCYAEEFEKYHGTGAIFTDSGNFLLELGCEAGVFALGLFLLLLAVRVLHGTVYRSYVKLSEVGALSDFVSVAMVVLTVYGAFCYLWADMTIYYLFWCVFGIGSSALRISKREFDDRTGYLLDGAGADSSSIDILVRE